MTADGVEIPILVVVGPPSSTSADFGFNLRDEEVSILVVVDRPLRHAGVGTGSVLVRYDLFQSLLSWIALFDKHDTTPASRFGKFQSLLSWIALFDTSGKRG